MNTKKKSAASKSTALVPVEKRAVAALGLQHREKELVTLAAATTHIVTITNDDGYKQVDAARKALKRERLAIQKVGDETIEEAKRVVKLADAELTRLVGIIESEEDRLKTLQDARDTEVEDQRQAEITAEMARQEALQARIAELQGNQTLSSTSGSALIAEHISDLEGIAVDESFEELLQQALDAKVAGLAWLREVHAGAVAHEAAQEKLRADLAELQRLRTEAAVRAAADAEREHAAKVERDAEAERHAAQLKQQADEAAREQAARQKIIDDSERIATEQKSVDWSSPLGSVPAQSCLPTVTLQTLRGDLSPESCESSNATSEEGDAIPSREQIVAALCDDFLLDEVQILAVLSRIDWQEALAEAA